MSPISAQASRANGWMIVPALFWIWYAVGLMIQLFFRLPDSWRFANGVFLVLYGVFAAFLLYAVAGETHRLRLIAWIGAIGLLSFGVEVIGSHTGVPFGRYAYTQTLGFAVLGVPVVVAFAWLGVTLNAVLLTVSRHPVLRALETGLWATALDLVLDPVAAVRGMWQWEPQGGTFYYGVPWFNFVAWFGLAALFSCALPKLGATVERPTQGVRLYQGMLLMFGLLAAKGGLYGPAVWSVVAIGAAEGRRRVR